MSAGEVKKEVPPLVTHTYPLCKYNDMSEEMRQEVTELCVTAVEKYADNYELAAKTIKHAVDQKFSPPFQVIVGESFSFSMTYQEKSLLFMYTGGSIAILVWRTVTGFT
ncbi:dynein light chain 4, axonemal-like [Orussus abietinus]|uniref:dynein light chain 4, axonemal-like n=1 Tax=Orussus abietinus TaxID=222816 RepID=UPI0006254672|nr:dynein light chain 4, axonemal-like [Orussus abietinus]